MPPVIGERNPGTEIHLPLRANKWPTLEELRLDKEKNPGRTLDDIRALRKDVPFASAKTMGIRFR